MVEREVDMEASEEMAQGMEVLVEMGLEGAPPWEMDLNQGDLQRAAAAVDQNYRTVCQGTKRVSQVVMDSWQRNPLATFILKSYRARTS